ncbi:hypothetical protein FB451DRAFT_101262 [Mycena latifolia]|nr:hypothetical protein FB451DRAFT_101262 [Mycena latifolia]
MYTPFDSCSSLALPMASQISPYDGAMRLGMGFNSFTQRLCNDYAVRPVGRRHEPSPDPTPPRYKPSAGPEGGNVDISQVVWTAKFVDRISEITDSLNVSHASQIKCDFAPGGTKTSASFVDTNKFIQSQINYLIQVRVTNQPSDPAEFDPIPGIPHSRFTRFYGDSFISGFVEGGEFAALISIKLHDRSKADQIKQQLELGFSFKADLVKPLPIDGETTIAVSWKGGGDILDGRVADWSLESLKAVVMEFPRKAMACPARTSAILTKYTSLKGFREKDIPNYENSGVYASTLLDAYMEYKSIWHTIPQTARQLEQGEFILVAQGKIPELAELSLEGKAMPNDLLPYKASIFGLDKARRDCRSEMLKIVREMNAVAEDPEVACDSTRPQQYLSPPAFRLLPPTARNLEKERAAQLATDAADAQEQLCRDLTRKLEESERQRIAAETSKKELEAKLRATEELNPYSGWCPVALRTPVRFRAYVSRKSMDHDYCEGKGSRGLYQYEVVNHPNQRFEIHPVGPKGFSIRHIASGRYLTTGNTGDSRVYMVIGDFPSIFTFEAQVDGTVLVHLAEQNQYTLNVESGGQHNRNKLIGWAGEKGDCDKWYIEGLSFQHIEESRVT